MADDKEKIAFFDFCGTLVPFQSAEAYVKYVISHTNSYAVKVRHLLYVTLHKLRLISRIERWTKGKVTNKKLMIYQIKGETKITLDFLAKSFVKEIIIPNLVPEIVTKWREYQENGYKMVIVSGGLDIYLQYVMRYFQGNEDNLFATTLVFKNDVFTGRMGFDCMGENKIMALQRKYYPKEMTSVAFSDSETDFPLLSWVDRGYLVIPIASWVDGSHICHIEYKYKSNQ